MATVRSPTKQRRNTYVQYSKRLAAVITGFWCFFRICCLVVLILRPTIADGMQGILQGVDDAMLCNIGFYAGNSVAEKGMQYYFRARTIAANNEDGDTTISNG